MEPTAARPDVDRLLAEAGVDDAERRALLVEALSWEGAGLVDTAVRSPADQERGTIVVALVEDRPFVFDTLLVAVRRSGFAPRAVDHPVLDIGGRRVAAMAVELDRRPDPEQLAALEERVRRMLVAAITVVDDVDESRALLQRAADELDDATEIPGLLRWLLDGRAVLLGVARHHLHTDPARLGKADEGTGLLAATSADGGPRSWSGTLSSGEQLRIPPPREVTAAAIAAGEPLVVGRLSSGSPVHRDVRPLELLIAGPADDAGGRTVTRLVYLLSHRAEIEPASGVPVLRGRVAAALEQADVRDGSHDEKRMLALYDAMPKEELLSIRPGELGELLRALLALAPDDVLVRCRRQTDPRTASVIVALSRERYVPAQREEIGRLVGDAYGTSDVVVREVMDDETHAQLHVGVYAADGDLPDVDEERLRAAVVDLSRTWTAATRQALVDADGDERGRILAARWLPRFPASYRATVDPSWAIADIHALERLERSGDASLVALRQEPGRDGPTTRVAFISRARKEELSRAIRILEDLGLTVLEERASRITGGPEEFWMQDFGVTGPDGGPLDLEAGGDLVQECITAVWRGETESDRLNSLVVRAGIGHRRLEVLRAYRRYRARIGSRYPESFQTDVIVSHPTTTADLIRLFELRFDPAIVPDEAGEQALRQRILEQIDAVESLDHDRILRNQLGFIDATVRTNAYVPGRRALALKFAAREVPAIPQPAPEREVYVLAPHVEGVHLRGGAIARGGLRWSDREDFRLEVWGLMRAQSVKNAVIVPAGAKGGFRLRAAPDDPAQLRREVERAYTDYIGALLDITDNRSGGAIVPPPHVRRRDGDDPYLVVAADKGTATFSDRANAVAQDRGFWLGDAFASGGSHGYDHKALGITARGAWESVKRHFRELDIDPERDPISVVGIGDMSGDVFGNGMLRSRTIRLIGAYDHRHVFLDPDPQDAEASFAERQRLFALPGSTWDDYDRALISSGGGVFPRTAKWIGLSTEVRERFGIEESRLAPNDLIRAMLRADVDLLWNGGIGTVVKSSEEDDADAQDRASDLIRVDARDLRARVVGEGGNLGFTQRGRIEFARHGGAVNADFIDNSAGVDCSDHEVNLKILLGEAIDRGRLDPAERDPLLQASTNEVCAHVLAQSARQARVLTDEHRRSAGRMEAYEELMDDLEETGHLIREDHDLPSSEQIADLQSSGQGLSRPELAVLLSLAKLRITDALLDSPLVDDRALEPDLLAYLPTPIRERLGDLAWDHPLRRELLAMLVAGDAVDLMGETFISRRCAEFGVDAGIAVRAYVIARDVCDAPALVGRIERLEGVASEVRWALYAAVQDAVRQASRWYLRYDVGGELPIRGTVEAHRAAADELAARVDGEGDVERRRAWREAGVPDDLAAAVSACRVVPFAPHLADHSARSGTPVAELAEAIDDLRDSLPFDQLREVVDQLPTAPRVARWANQALRDDLLTALAEFAALVAASADDHDSEAAVDAVITARPAAIRKLETLVRDAQLSSQHQFAGATVAVRQLRELVAWMRRERARAGQDQRAIR